MIAFVAHSILLLVFQTKSSFYLTAHLTRAPPASFAEISFLEHAEASITEKTVFFLPLRNYIRVKFIRKAFFLIDLAYKDILAFQLIEDIGIPSVVAGVTA